MRLSSSQSCPSDSELDADVIIIGAGMAGISAAERLQEGGISNILILEGSARIGGRVSSAQIGGVTVSLGAAWIQGVDETRPDLHPLYQIAQRYGGLRGFYPDYESLTNYNSQGNQPDEALFSNRTNDFYTALEATAARAIQLKASGECANVNFRSGLSLGGWTPTSDIDNWIEWYNSDYYSGVEPEVLSLCLRENDPTYTAFVSADDISGDYFVTDSNGYENIIERMANDAKLKSDQTRVVFNAVVTTVDTSRGDCVCVSATLNGVANYCARYAISTVSVGVLQSGSIQFIPELQTSKREVIQRFEMSHYVHVIMQFTEAFWDTTEQIGYIDSSRRAYYPIFLNYHSYYPEQPNILVAQITGAEADRVLRQDKAVTIAEVEQILTTLYPTSNITILESIVTDWLNNPLFRGSYIYYSTDIRPGDHTLLAAPVKNLYFSGAATSSNFSGYLHGAYYAGREAAESVIGKTNKAAKMQISILIVLLGVLCAFYNN